MFEKSHLHAINMNLEATHRAHGRAFEAAHRAMAALNPCDPVDRIVVQSIMAQPDPGAAMLQWHERVHGRSAQQAIASEKNE